MKKSRKRNSTLSFARKNIFTVKQLTLSSWLLGQATTAREWRAVQSITGLMACGRPSPLFGLEGASHWLPSQTARTQPGCHISCCPHGSVTNTRTRTHTHTHAPVKPTYKLQNIGQNEEGGLGFSSLLCHICFTASDFESARTWRCLKTFDSLRFRVAYTTGSDGEWLVFEHSEKLTFVWKHTQRCLFFPSLHS